jgi:hypothetical protein
MSAVDETGVFPQCFLRILVSKLSTFEFNEQESWSLLLVVFASLKLAENQRTFFGTLLSDFRVWTKMNPTVYDWIVLKEHC